jgi:hypothetical protein
MAIIIAKIRVKGQVIKRKLVGNIKWQQKSLTNKILRKKQKQTVRLFFIF